MRNLDCPAKKYVISVRVFRRLQAATKGVAPGPQQLFLRKKLRKKTFLTAFGGNLIFLTLDIDNPFRFLYNKRICPEGQGGNRKEKNMMKLKKDTLMPLGRIAAYYGLAFILAIAAGLVL